MMKKKLERKNWNKEKKIRKKEQKITTTDTLFLNKIQCIDYEMVPLPEDSLIDQIVRTTGWRLKCLQ